MDREGRALRLEVFFRPALPSLFCWDCGSGQARFAGPIRGQEFPMFRSSLGSLCSWTFLSASLFLLSPMAQGQKTFYVNGKTGKDLAGYGASAAKPWKTISFALSKITPPTQPQNSHVLKVAGGQTYGQATNGESFPLRPIYNVSIEAPLYTGSFWGRGRMASSSTRRRSSTGTRSRSRASRCSGAGRAR